jgi:hypothetical protein
MLKKLLLATVLIGVFMAQPALADKPDGKVEWRNSASEPRKSVVIRRNGNTTILRTSPEMADRIQRMIERNPERVIIRSRRGHSYYPDNYYPYYTRKGAAYSTGRALGTKLSDDKYDD